jgi:hypothetical protein
VHNPDRPRGARFLAATPAAPSRASADLMLRLTDSQLADITAVAATLPRCKRVRAVSRGT